MGSSDFGHPDSDLGAFRHDARRLSHLSSAARPRQAGLPGEAPEEQGCNGNRNLQNCVHYMG
jgi:hypothetical protein